MNTMKGSRLRICEWVNDRPELFETYLADWGPFSAARDGEPLQWLAPKRPDCREVRDGLWGLAGLPGDTPQAAGWWPARGPVWDAVARVPGMQHGVLLVEAKSHLAELRSPGTAAGGTRLELIEQSLAEVKADLGVPAATSWTARYYQVANRLAFVWFMRDHGIDAWLLSVYFVADSFDPDGGRLFPRERAEWEQAIHDAHTRLSIPARHRLSDFVFDAFVPAMPD
jgi:hypothetical protein